MINWIRSFWSWSYVGTKGTYCYYENIVTKKRRAVKCAGLYGPVDKRWVSGLEDDLHRPDYVSHL